MVFVYFGVHSLGHLQWACSAIIKPLIAVCLSKGYNPSRFSVKQQLQPPPPSRVEAPHRSTATLLSLHRIKARFVEGPEVGVPGL